MMKRIYILLVAVACSLTLFAQQGLEEQYQSAAQLYAEKEYRQAADIYAQLLQYGVSADLYYNYGNALLKSNQIGKAVLAYERALRLNPHFEQAKYNLEYANLQKSDKIETIEPFFLVQWGRTITHLCAADVWGYISISLFVLALVMVLIYLFAKNLPLRKAGFAIAFIAFILSLAAFGFAYSAKSYMLNDKEAIVLSGSVTVKSTPDVSGTEVFVIHEATKVTILQELGDWCEIKIADGNIGWLPMADIEVI